MFIRGRFYRKSTRSVLFASQYSCLVLSLHNLESSSDGSVSNNDDSMEEESTEEKGELTVF